MLLRLFKPDDPAEPQALVERYLDDLSERARQGRLSPDTSAMRARYVRLFFEHSPTIEPTNEHIISWLGAHPEWVSPHTISDAVASVIACLSWGLDNDLVDRVRVKKRRLGLKTPQPRAAMPMDDITHFLRTIKTCSGYKKSRAALRLGVWFMAKTGVRTCEFRTLRWEWIDFRRGIAVLDEHKTDANGLPRIIVLPRVVLRILWRHRKPTGIVFMNGRGRPWTKGGFPRLFRQYLVRIGMAPKVSPYSVRHGFCAACIDAEDERGERELDDGTIAELMGHSSTRLIKYYGRTAKPKVDRLRGKVDKVGRWKG